MMDNIVEMIPDERPEWAQKALEEGLFFNVALQKIKDLELNAERFQALLSADELIHPCKPPLFNGGWHAGLSGKGWRCGIFAPDLVELADKIRKKLSEMAKDKTDDR